MVQAVGNCHYRGVMKGLMERYYKYHIRITDITNVCFKTPFGLSKSEEKRHFGVVQAVGNCLYRGVMKGLMERYYKYHIRITDITNVCFKTPFGLSKSEEKDTLV